MSNAAPSTRQLADALGVEGADLRYFVENHPNPTVEIVTEWAAHEGDPYSADVKEEVSEYLAENGGRYGGGK